MKIGISTIIDYNNYGNRLQNYAVQKVLEKINMNGITINYNNEKRSKQIIFKQYVLIKISQLYFVTNLKILGNIFSHEKLIAAYKYYKFKSFTKKNITMTDKEFFNFNELKNLNCNYDYFITGSDQVWNYNFRPNVKIDFLQFATHEKRISYAASFGVSEISEEYKDEYIKYLNGMNYLSVREHAGQKIIKDLIGKDAEVLIDPTMMLNKVEWLQVASKPKCTPNKKYLLTYVLGNQTEELKDFVNQLAKEKDLEVLNLLDPYDKDIYCVDPGEFVYLINQADVMITDSFHGAVFSILMETPFVIFERQDTNVSMNSRIDTLVTTFKMESRLSSHIKTIEDVYNIDFSHIDEILKYERDKARMYLQNAFSMEE